MFVGDDVLSAKFRGKKVVLLALLLILIVVSIVFVYNNHVFYQDPIAEIIEVELEDEVGVPVGTENQDVVYTQNIEAVLKNGDLKGEPIVLTNEFAESSVYHSAFKVGDELFVTLDAQTEREGLTGTIIDVKRDHDLVLISWLFIGVLFAIAKRQGLLAVLSLVINALIISWALDVYIHTSNIRLLVIMCVAVVLMTTLSLLFVSGFSDKTYAAIAATLLGTFSLLVITSVVLYVTDQEGLRFEEMEFLTRPPQAIFMSGVLVGALGAVMDVAVTISSSLFNLYEKNKAIKASVLKESGIEIGKDIMGTMTNILFFAYVSGTIPTLILYFMNGASLGFTLSMNLSLELTRALAGGIGIVLTIPIGLYTTLFFINRKQASV